MHVLANVSKLINPLETDILRSKNVLHVKFSSYLTERGCATLAASDNTVKCRGPIVVF